MNSLAIIGGTIIGFAAGGMVGLWLGEREGGDYNFAPAIYGPAGAALGAVAGAATSALVFA